MDFKLNTTYHLSTDGYSFRYRNDRYDINTIHVEMFKNGDIVHKQIAVSETYNVNICHSDMINALESKITLNELDKTGLKQTV